MEVARTLQSISGWALAAMSMKALTRRRKMPNGRTDFGTKSMGDTQPLPCTPIPLEREIMEACCKAMVRETPIKIRVQDMLIRGPKEFPPPNGKTPFLA